LAGGGGGLESAGGLIKGRGGEGSKLKNPSCTGGAEGIIYTRLNPVPKEKGVGGSRKRTRAVRVVFETLPGTPETNSGNAIRNGHEGEKK